VREAYAGSRKAYLQSRVRAESWEAYTAGAVLPCPVRPRESWVRSFADKPTRVGRRLTTRDEIPFTEVGLQVVLPGIF
jgi:hypothetical protein